MRVRKVADNLLEKCMRDYEEFNSELVWDILDHYKQASLLAREHDLESEAIAISRIGRVFATIIKNEERGHEYFLRAIELAQSLMPKTFYNVDWYKEAHKAVEEHRKKIIEKEEKEKEPQRQKIREKLKV